MPKHGRNPCRLRQGGCQSKKLGQLTIIDPREEKVAEVEPRDDDSEEDKQAENKPSEEKSSLIKFVINELNADYSFICPDNLIVLVEFRRHKETHKYHCIMVIVDPVAFLTKKSMDNFNHFELDEDPDIRHYSPQIVSSPSGRYFFFKSPANAKENKLYIVDVLARKLKVCNSFKIYNTHFLSDNKILAYSDDQKSYFLYTIDMSQPNPLIAVTQCNLQWLWILA